MAIQVLKSDIRFKHKTQSGNVQYSTPLDFLIVDQGSTYFETWNSQIQGIVNSINNNLSTVNNFCQGYKANQRYQEGSYIYYNNQLYCCTSTIQKSTNWNNDKRYFQRTTISDQLTELFNNKLDKPANGTVGQILTKTQYSAVWSDFPNGDMISTAVAQAVASWMSDNLTIPENQSYILDDSLTLTTAAAQAKATGDAINSIVKVSVQQPDDNFNKIWIHDIQTGAKSVFTQEEIQNIIAPAYAIETSYKEGDYVIYNGALYYITADINANENIGWENINKIQLNISKQINNLKSAIFNAYNLTNFEFVWGNVYNGSINTEKTRIHSVEMIWLPKGTKIKTSSSFANFTIARYNLDGSYAANLGEWVLEYTSPVNCYGRIVMRKPSGEIAESEIPGLVETLSIFYSTAAETELFKASSENTSKTELTEILRSEYGLLDLKDTDNAVVANLFDKDAPGVTTNGYYDRTNTFVSSTTIGGTDYIRVFPGWVYYTNLNAGYFVLWYDENKTYLTYSNVSNGSTFTAIANATYMRTIFLVADINSYAVKCNAITSIKASHSNFAGKNGVAFGTSLTYRAQTTGGYLQFLPALCGATIENKGLGNSTILDNGSNPKMLDVITGYSGYASKDFVILEGFVNDWYNNAASLGTWKDTGTTTVCGCVRTALIHILTQNPSTTVIMVIDPIGKSASGVDCSSLATRNGLTQSEFYDELAKVAHNIGIPVIRVDQNSGMSELTPYMYIDNIHPNEEGAEQTAKTIWADMQRIPIKVVDET